MNLLLIALLAAAPANTTYVKAGRLIDGTGAAVRSDVVITIEGERITAVAPASSSKIPDGARVVDAILLAALGRVSSTGEQRRAK